jgi:hypothetical protein
MLNSSVTKRHYLLQFILKTRIKERKGFKVGTFILNSGTQPQDLTSPTQHGRYAEI